MSIFASDIVDWKALGEVVLYSLLAGVGVALMYSIAIVGATRFADLRRDDRLVGAAVYAVLGVIGLAVSVAAIVAGIIVMTQK